MRERKRERDIGRLFREEEEEKRSYSIIFFSGSVGGGEEREREGGKDGFFLNFLSLSHLGCDSLEKYLKGFENLGCICIESKDLMFCAELGF